MNKIFNFIKNAFRNTKKVNNYNSYSYDVIIHIGAPKTGSSAIQHFLLESRRNLEKFGYFYPEHGKDINNISGGHSNLGLAIINEEYDKAKMIYDGYLTEAKSKGLTLLLSAESFYQHPERLKKLISNEKVKIISFFRNPLEAIFSNYNQGVKRHFQTNTIETFCNNVLSQKNNSYLMGDILNIWKELFGEEHGSVIEYDKKRFETVSIQEVFLENIGMQEKAISHIKPKKIEIINKSYSSAQLEFKRVVNYVLDKEDHKNNNALDRFLQKTSDQESYDSLPLALELPSDMITQLEEKFSSKITLTSSEVFSMYKRLQQILLLIDALKEEEIDIYEYIKICINDFITSHTIIPLEVYILAQWFDVYISPIKYYQKWFNQNQLNNMIEGNYKEADFLRDIATLSLNRGDLENADMLITRALQTRPNGPGIIIIKEKITELKIKNGEKK